jgi:hypothetical protein
MKIVAAPTHEQGQDFVVLLVKDRVISDPNGREDMLDFGAQNFGVRAALMGERQHKTYGPPDIVRWLNNVHFEQLPWREYSFN